MKSRIWTSGQNTFRLLFCGVLGAFCLVWVFLFVLLGVFLIFFFFFEDRGGRFRDAGNSSKAFDFFPSRFLLRVSPIPNGRPVLQVMAK